MLERVLLIGGTKYIKVPAPWWKRYDVKDFVDVKESPEGLLIRIPKEIPDEGLLISKSEVKQ
ncbi:hypothetical protein [Ferroplasma acidiphilum]|uniref:hypothetical protein n=1 Tax=Ferroplasma acidiphilum TaxID=74969 RepID=UPI002815E030|nr:hypothetical protein [Ferroplasma acidiphilum]WMT54120.1 MAG: hypothetical protein RE473_04525 [Ferroplasma acidiphilum]